jgi:hypothetical protein
MLTAKSSHSPPSSSNWQPAFQPFLISREMILPDMLEHIFWAHIYTNRLSFTLITSGGFFCDVVQKSRSEGAGMNTCTTADTQLLVHQHGISRTAPLCGTGWACFFTCRIHTVQAKTRHTLYDPVRFCLLKPDP